MNSGSLLFSTNWQEIALFIAQNRSNFSFTDLSTMNKRLQTALEMKYDYFNGHSNISLSSQIRSFL